MTVVEMESKLEEIISLMLQHQKKGEYIQAENCRLDSERLKK